MSVDPAYHYDILAEKKDKNNLTNCNCIKMIAFRRWYLIFLSSPRNGILLDPNLWIRIRAEKISWSGSLLFSLNLLTLQSQKYNSKALLKWLIPIFLGHSKFVFKIRYLWNLLDDWKRVMVLPFMEAPNILHTMPFTAIAPPGLWRD